MDLITLSPVRPTPVVIQHGQYLAWSTKDELMFLRYLGRWGKNSSERARLLKLYAQAILQRDKWGNIDPNAIWAYLGSEGVC